MTNITRKKTGSLILFESKILCPTIKTEVYCREGLNSRGNGCTAKVCGLGGIQY